MEGTEMSELREKLQGLQLHVVSQSGTAVMGASQIELEDEEVESEDSYNQEATTLVAQNQNVVNNDEETELSEEVVICSSIQYEETEEESETETEISKEVVIPTRPIADFLKYKIRVVAFQEEGVAENPFAKNKGELRKNLDALQSSLLTLQELKVFLLGDASKAIEALKQTHQSLLDKIGGEYASLEIEDSTVNFVFVTPVDFAALSVKSIQNLNAWKSKQQIETDLIFCFDAWDLVKINTNLNINTLLTEYGAKFTDAKSKTFNFEKDVEDFLAENFVAYVTM